MNNNFIINDKAKCLSMLCIEKLAFIRRYLNTFCLSVEQNESYVEKKDLFLNPTKKIFSLLVKSFDTYCGSMEKDDSKLLDHLRCVLETINTFCEELSILPTYEAPVEIYRFLRIFDRDGIASLDDNKIKFILYAAEKKGQLKIFENTPLEEFECGALRICHRLIESSEGGGHQTSNRAYHISIPREEMGVPLYWPLLAHEVGHQVMTKRLFDEQEITAAFSAYVEANFSEKYSPSFLTLIGNLPEPESREKVLKNWLTECWCDVYGYFATGPAFIFAQRNSFVSKKGAKFDSGTLQHPPCYLRLLVLDSIASDHQPDIYGSESYRTALDSVLAEFLIDCEDSQKDCIFDVAQWFLCFFKNHFKMDTVDTEKLKKHVVKLKGLKEKITSDSLPDLIERLSSGYPIPSHRIGESLYEKETSVHEIMLAAWASRDVSLVDEVITLFGNRFTEFRVADENESWELFESELAPLFDKFDQAIMRSLQIGEWVNLFRDLETKNIAEEIEILHPVSYLPGMLADNQIRELLIRDELKFIPLIHIDKQLGSTSLDVRLGTTFQIYQPNQSGVINFFDDKSVAGAQANSTVKDLDYPDGLVLAPGQFVLAHTMEYIGLPENVGAQLEGRSSFARLGIQIHMTASFIDPGFRGSITFEIFNAGPNPIKLYPGYRIGQLRFFACKKPDKPYNKKTQAKYKGLLGHSSSLLGNDYEMQRLKEIFSRGSCA